MVQSECKSSVAWIRMVHLSPPFKADTELLRARIEAKI